MTFTSKITQLFDLSVSQKLLDLTQKWHESDPELPNMDEISFESLVQKVHFYNYSLWHEEDEARRVDVTDELIAKVKREIDYFNQNRNDTIQEIDELMVNELVTGGNSLSSGPLNSETPGSMIDRLSIMGLKVYHMDEIATNPKEPEEIRQKCLSKVKTLNEQRKDLENCMLDLLNDIKAGKRHFKVYFQFKMYNDPQLNQAVKKANQ